MVWPVGFKCSFCGVLSQDSARMFKSSTASICADCVTSCAMKLTEDDKASVEVRLVSLRAKLEDMRLLASDALEHMSHAQARLREMGGDE